MKILIFIIAAIIGLIALPIDPRISIVMILMIASSFVTVKLGRFATLVVFALLVAAVFHLLN
jgi:hypothetical protein